MLSCVRDIFQFNQIVGKHVKYVMWIEDRSVAVYYINYDPLLSTALVLIEA